MAARCERCDREGCRRLPSLEAMQGVRASLSDWTLDRALDAAEADCAAHAVNWRAKYKALEPLIADLIDEMRAVVIYTDKRAAGGQVTGPSSMGRLGAVGPGVVQAFREYIKRFYAATKEGA